MKTTTRNQLVALVISAVLLVWQCLTLRDIREPWAEDATDIIPFALTGSWNPFHPMVDMFFVIGRLFGFVAVSISLEWAPLILSIFSIVLLSFATSYFCRSGFAWLVPSDVFRFFASLGMSLGLGTTEVAGNVACSMYVLPVLAFFLVLERPRVKGIVPAWIFIALSTPLLFLAIPLLGLLYAVRRERTYLYLLAVSGLSILLSAAVRAVVQHPASPDGLHLSWNLLEVVDVSFAAMFASLVGSPIALTVLSGPTEIYIVGLVLIAFFYYALRNMNREIAAVVVGLFATVPAYHFVHALGRDYGYNLLDLSLVLWVSSRFAFLTILFPVLAWLIVLSQGVRLSPLCRRPLLALPIIANCVFLSCVATAPLAREPSTWRDFQAWLTAARHGVAPSGSSAEFLVWLPTHKKPVLWAILRCVREADVILCRTKGGNNGTETHRIPVAASVSPS